MKKHQPFYVIWQNFNQQKFEPYDVMPYFINEYNESKNKPKTFEEFKKFIKDASMYRYWSRCEYEIVICGWPNQDTEEKWDIHRQVIMNIDIVTDILMKNVQWNLNILTDVSVIH